MADAGILCSLPPMLEHPPLSLFVLQCNSAGMGTDGMDSGPFLWVQTTPLHGRPERGREDRDRHAAWEDPHLSSGGPSPSSSTLRKFCFSHDGHHTDAPA